MRASARWMVHTWRVTCRDIDTIDAELRLLVAVRHHVREHGGPLPPAALVDSLLDERATSPHERLRIG